MLLLFAPLIGGLVLLILGAEVLVRGSVRLATRLRISTLVIGLTVVAFGTSSPELAVSISAGLKGLGDVSLGNVIGSNIANIGLILGVSALINPLQVQQQVIRRELPILFLATAVVWLCLLDGKVGRLEGALLFAGVVFYTGYTLWESRRSAQADEDSTTSTTPLYRDFLLLLVGLALLLLGARLLTDGAVGLARHFSIPEAVIALTIIAMGTSLPELATSLMAALRKENDVAVGNVVGSNIFNLFAILGIAALVTPLAATNVGTFDLAVMMGATLLILPLMWSGFTVTRWEGALLLLGYGVYLYLLLP